ncbi:putative hernekeitto protein, similar to dallas pulla [Helicobacter bizzozeronii CIII-1]|uniref:Putative hernekeitto protein, similar to dallas pulla n=1 Tax=Helicobacter bizzozeronii (strain CIII-1) TaxID=1002804 RepID=F8KQJ3_HELBC|nr:hypothetical protein [Helicobacter bizzozeronii]CCB78997.1 putative hernekeitto protein, similar to dallas pulla [Helicobacter bizzozeronii CIII-1]
MQTPDNQGISILFAQIEEELLNLEDHLGEVVQELEELGHYLDALEARFRKS